VESFGSFRRSLDGGQTWSFLTILGSANTIAVDPQVPNVVYVGTDNDLRKSVNGGSSFAAAATGLPSFRAVEALAIDGSSSMTLYAGVTGEGVFKSTNGGANWAKASTGITDHNIRALAVQPSASSTLFAGTNSGIFKSTNGGESWSSANAGLPSSKTTRGFAFDAQNPSIIYAALSGGVYQSNDGGANWTLLAGTTSPSGLSSIVAGTDGNFLHAGANGGVWSWQFRASDPQLEILWPSAGAGIVNGSALHISVTDFAFDCNATAANSGRGIWRLDVDGALDSTGCTTSPRLTKSYGIGAHTIVLSLRNPDGSALSPPIERSVSVTIVAAKPRGRAARR
jgi:hypothetical protein